MNERPEHGPERRIASAESAPDSVRQGAPGGDETILVIDDDVGVARVVSRGLARIGYDVLSAQAFEGAVQHAREHAGPIHLLLTDVVMPGTNGREVDAAVRQLRPDVRVLYMSGYAEDTVVHDGVLDADVDLVQKPFTLDELASAVRRVLDRQPS